MSVSHLGKNVLGRPGADKKANGEDGGVPIAICFGKPLFGFFFGSEHSEFNVRPWLIALSVPDPAAY